MASGFDRFVYEPAGYIEVMQSPGVEALLQSMADRVKASADQMLAGDDIELYADTTVGRTRAGGTVLGVPMRIEADRRVLGRSIGAAKP